MIGAPFRPCQHQLAGRVPQLPRPVGVARALQRERLGDEHPQPPVVDQRGELLQAVAVGLDQHADGAQAPVAAAASTASAAAADGRQISMPSGCSTSSERSGDVAADEVVDDVDRLDRPRSNSSAR